MTGALVQGGSSPPYLRIAHELRRRIETGALAPGARVPSTRQLMRRHRVAMATASKALAALQREGLIHSQRGAGSVVSGRPPMTARVRVADPGALSRDKVVRAAIAVADAEGLEAVSMRRVSTELGVAPMALYRHLPGKDELLEEMSEQVLRDAGLPMGELRGWRARFEALARLEWLHYQRHPWVAQVFARTFTRPAPRPAGMAHTEWLLGSIEGVKLSRSQRLHLAVTLVGYVQGTALKLVSEIDAQAQSGISSEDFVKEHDPELMRVVLGGGFPAMMKLLDGPDIDFDLDSLFEFGLQRLLDGFARLLDR